MVTPIPRAANLKSGIYDNEPGTFTDISANFKYLLENHIRRSLTSPPLLKDVKEGTFVWDSTLKRLYTTSDGVLRYVAFT